VRVGMVKIGSRPWGALALVAGLAGVLALGGCMKRPVPVRPAWSAHAYSETPLAPSAAVFGATDAGSATARNDTRYAHARGGLDGVLNAWPEAPRPSLRDARRQTYSSASQFVYVPGAGARGMVRRPARTVVVVPPAPRYWTERPPVYHPSRPPSYPQHAPHHAPHHPGSIWR